MHTHPVKYLHNLVLLLESAPKAKLRKMERKLVPVLEKLSVEELMETNTYQRFNRSLEKIFEDVEDVMMNETGKVLFIVLYINLHPIPPFLKSFQVLFLHNHPALTVCWARSGH